MCLNLCRLSESHNTSTIISPVLEQFYAFRHHHLGIIVACQDSNDPTAVSFFSFCLEESEP